MPATLHTSGRVRRDARRDAWRNAGRNAGRNGSPPHTDLLHDFLIINVY